MAIQPTGPGKGSQKPQGPQDTGELSGKGVKKKGLMGKTFGKAKAASKKFGKALIEPKSLFGRGGAEGKKLTLEQSLANVKAQDTPTKDQITELKQLANAQYEKSEGGPLSKSLEDSFRLVDNFESIERKNLAALNDQIGKILSSNEKPSTDDLGKLLELINLARPMEINTDQVRKAEELIAQYVE